MWKPELVRSGKNRSGKWNICICIVVMLVCMLHQNACDVVRFIANNIQGNVSGL